MSNYKTKLSKLSLLVLLMGTANPNPVEDEDEKPVGEANQPKTEEEEEPAGEYDRYIRDALFAAVGMAGTLCVAALFTCCTAAAPASP